MKKKRLKNALLVLVRNFFWLRFPWRYKGISTAQRTVNNCSKTGSRYYQRKSANLYVLRAPTWVFSTPVVIYKYARAGPSGNGGPVSSGLRDAYSNPSSHYISLRETERPTLGLPSVLNQTSGLQNTWLSRSTQQFSEWRTFGRSTVNTRVMAILSGGTLDVVTLPLNTVPSK